MAEDPQKRIHVKRRGGDGGGPRTVEGKNRSKRNATKHAIFSTAVVLRGESRAGYDAFLEALRRTQQPQGMLEEAFMEKLAIDFWRLRRSIIAENIEIDKSTLFMNGIKTRKTDWRTISNHPKSGKVNKFELRQSLSRGDHGYAFSSPSGWLVTP
jgi:hypothetical protein